MKAKVNNLRMRYKNEWDILVKKMPKSNEDVQRITQISGALEALGLLRGES